MKSDDSLMLQLTGTFVSLLSALILQFYDIQEHEFHRYKLHAEMNEAYISLRQ